MLVLTRKTDQSIRIADDIEVLIVSVRGNRVRLGIRAPSEVSIKRKEVIDRAQQQFAEVPLHRELAASGAR